MFAYAAYHRSYLNGNFNRKFYITQKFAPQVNDLVYVISGENKKQTQYFLEGCYLVQAVEPWPEGKRKLMLKEERLPTKKPLINAQPWYSKEFRNRYVIRGVSSISDEYVQRLDVLIDTADGAFNAIDDIDENVAKHERVQGFYSRNDVVRQQVLRRAGGRCEYCGSLGFAREDGSRYLETHHIIFLADQGPDSTSNVIAICANEHREAHFGANRYELENEFKDKLKRFR